MAFDAVRDKDHPFGKNYRDHNPGDKVHKAPMPSVEECESVEETIQKLEAIPCNKKLLKQIGVRESLFRVRSPPSTTRHVTTLLTRGRRLSPHCRSVSLPRLDMTLRWR